MCHLIYKMQTLFRVIILVSFADWCFVHSEEQVPKNRTIRVNETHIFLNRKVMHILSGELHYFRVPSEYWRDRLRKMKAAGLNTVSTFVEWSYHEPEERQYRFSGDYDVAKFVRTAAEEKLLVILRPGPYICAERDLGGIPYWLFSKYPDIQLRTTNKDFIRETERWIDRLFEYVKPLLFGRGGPIFFVQVENEYGSYGTDNTYMGLIRDMYKKHVESHALLFTANGIGIPPPLGRVKDTLSAVNYGPDALLRKRETAIPGFFTSMSKIPLICSEFYTGWFSTWGYKIKAMNHSTFVALFDTIMSFDIPMHFNFYMFFGGTNFEFYSGATVNNGLYKYFTTSYDYTAPINEAGDLTAMYFLIKNTITKFYPIKSRWVPISTPKGDYGKVVVQPCIRLLHPEGRMRLGKWYHDVTGSVLPTFEQLRQRAGLLMYETTMVRTNGTLYIAAPRDIVYVYVDGNLQGVIDNMFLYNKAIPITTKPGSRLSLLVENMGRMSVTVGIRLRDLKGILSPVVINGKAINGRWFITGFPLQSMRFRSCVVRDVPDVRRGPVLYQANFTIREAPLDTYFYPAGWGKGYVWVNGHNLGRYWPTRGPQLTLYVPGVWLKAAPALNLVHLLELVQAPENLTIMFVNSPIIMNDFH